MASGNGDTRETLAQWLRDAHAMEGEALSIMSRQIERLENYPEMKQRLQEHVRETERQKDNIARCLERLGESPSTFKDVSTKVMGNMAALGHSLSSDEVLKNALADYAFESFEIASYKSLTAAAEAAGEREIAETCRSIQREEEAMAQWISDNLGMLTQKYLARDISGQTAKR